LAEPDQAHAAASQTVGRFSVTLGLTDQQLKFVTAICQPLPVEKRSVFLRRIALANSRLDAPPEP
jgi:hypothetical protein